MLPVVINVNYPSISMENLFKACPNGCNSELQPSKLIVAEGELKKCPSCGQLVSSCSKDYYEKSNQEWNSEEGTWPSDRDYARLFKRRKNDIYHIAKILSKDNSDIRILDVGCSNGSFVFIANSLGLQAEGIDPSEKAVNNGIKRGLKLHLGLLNDLAFDNDSFDAITLHEVIEHVSDPITLLKECARILRPNGVLLVGTGNTESWTRQMQKSKWDFFDMKKHGGHISFFSPKSLNILASRTGFSVVKVATHNVSYCEKGELPHILYRTIKIFTELLNLPAKLLMKGHQMEVFLKVNKSA
jgi:2-polyprenyl-3-methyl-5-hydroxy-6-metoxy-1,4-benzoquinol methylase